MIYSGASNSESGVHWFQLYLANLQDELQNKWPEAQLQFRTFLEGDGLMTNRFLCYLQHEGYDLERVAILSEDETAFGNVAKQPTKTVGPLGCQNAKPGQPQLSPDLSLLPA